MCQCGTCHAPNAKNRLHARQNATLLVIRDLNHTLAQDNMTTNYPYFYARPVATFAKVKGRVSDAVLVSFLHLIVLVVFIGLAVAAAISNLCEKHGARLASLAATCSTATKPLRALASLLSSIVSTAIRTSSAAVSLAGRVVSALQASTATTRCMTVFPSRKAPGAAASSTTHHEKMTTASFARYHRLPAASGERRASPDVSAISLKPIGRRW